MKTYFVEVVEHPNSCRPVDASVSDTDTVPECVGTSIWDVLPSSIDVGLDHDTGDVTVSSGELNTEVIHNEGLVVVVLLRVAVC